VTPSHAPIAPADTVERYLARIEAHLVRLAQGQDPFGHLLAVERLARAARADWCEAERQSSSWRSWG
jgi:hypothetical protein